MVDLGQKKVNTCLPFFMPKIENWGGERRRVNFKFTSRTSRFFIPRTSCLPKVFIFKSSRGGEWKSLIFSTKLKRAVSLLLLNLLFILRNLYAKSKYGGQLNYCLFVISIAYREPFLPCPKPIV